MTEEDLSKLGAPVETKQIWETVISAISEHITTICFTQNPNDMPYVSKANILHQAPYTK